MFWRILILAPLFVLAACSDGQEPQALGDVEDAGVDIDDTPAPCDVEPCEGACTSDTDCLEDQIHLKDLRVRKEYAEMALQVLDAIITYMYEYSFPFRHILRFWRDFQSVENSRGYQNIENHAVSVKFPDLKISGCEKLLILY